jgi:hypothetical protein
VTLVPDSAAPVAGWRIWNVADQGRGPELVSPVVRATWEHRVPITAACEAGCRRSPSVRCGCGLYATARLDLRLFGYRRETTVLGCTALWGRVVEHRDGWRGQHGYPLVLFVVSALPDDVIGRMRIRVRSSPAGISEYLAGISEADGIEALSRELARLYAVPVHPAPSLRITRASRVDEREADAVRSEAVAGLAARRSGDPEARDRLTRCVRGLLDSAA